MDCDKNFVHRLTVRMNIIDLLDRRERGVPADDFSPLEEVTAVEDVSLRLEESFLENVSVELLCGLMDSTDAIYSMSLSTSRYLVL